MPYQLIDISVAEKHPHPRLANRINGRVRAVLNEERDGAIYPHELSIPVWAETTKAMSDGDIDMALMLKAATIVTKLKATLERSDAGTPA